MSDIPPPISDQPVLQLQDVAQRYGGTKVLHGVTLQVRRGEIAVVLGAQGAGHVEDVIDKRDRSAYWIFRP